ncbi:MAG: hypothetical protein DIZ80_08710 [endosymbiont of Galathealinum brachiosum]|uniref:General secretion pathway protein GspF n=1 Tax=endosymbiont of Galathealinum brachiosum TaxID=2200906 RepID=A0A370DDX9_9GAMM|nr:MAG: hypothetical protein DIZ80_08710 [endosymbiont of Galathealinum brachiosum]
MRRARTVEEYVAWMKDALYEVEDMRASIEYDEEGMGATKPFIEEIESSLKNVFKQMESGEYCWNTGDLSYISVIRELDESVVPFRQLLIRINDTHKNGLETEEE